MYNSFGDFMKKLVTVIIILVLISFSACSGQPKIILDNSSNSRFIDFYTEKDSVYFECELNVYAEKECEVKISAIDNDNVETGLLKSNTLVGINKENGDDVFALQSGENNVTVLFKGEYSGIYQISAREIPRFITIEKA